MYGNIYHIRSLQKRLSFDERMLSSFSVKIIVAILIFPTVEGWVEEELSTKGVGKKKEMRGVEQ